jgi:hypothetical protein
VATVLLIRILKRRQQIGSSIGVFRVPSRSLLNGNGPAALLSGAFVALSMSPVTANGNKASGDAVGMLWPVCQQVTLDGNIYY